MAAEDCKRVQILRELMASAHLPEHGRRQTAAAQKLGMTMWSVRRLVRQLREGGIGSVVRLTRSECTSCTLRERGEARISQEWQEFIVKTYRVGERVVGV